MSGKTSTSSNNFSVQLLVKSSAEVNTVEKKLNRSMETDESCTLVLQLSENDPLFEKKKNLLFSVGFDVKEEMQLQRSTFSDSIASTLERILPMARVMHLDEVELYFGEIDKCSSVEYYSPRNEMVALNFLLSLIHKSDHSETQIGKSIFRDLQGAIIERIQNLALMNKVVTRLDKNYSCESEKCLLKWAESNGVKTSLDIACIEGAGRGAIAAKDLEVGDVALEIPVSVIISEVLVLKSDMYPILEKIDGISSETMLLLWSMKERHNSNSKFKLYFDTLPKEFNTGLRFGVNTILTLDGTLLLEEIMQAKEHLRLQYEELVPPLFNSHPDIFPLELYTWEQFLWACELWYSNSMKVMFFDGALKTCLVPIAGFLNHSLYPHIINFGKVDPTTMTMKFQLSRPCSAGEECCLNYGNFTSSHLISFYGFLPKGENPYDAIPLDIDFGEQDCSGNQLMFKWTSHMVRGTWFSTNHELFYYGLPSPLLDYLRRARNPKPLAKITTRAMLETEMEILEDLQSIFINMIENLSESDISDREDASWDVKLALEYKDLQRKIVSSLVSSCSSGLQLVQNELLNCPAEE